MTTPVTARTRSRIRDIDLGDKPEAHTTAISDPRKLAVIHQLEEQLGVVSYACKAASVSRRTFYYWVANDPDFAKEVDDVINFQVDYVERKLLTNIKEGKEKSIIFYLSTKGRHRGYCQRVEVGGTPGSLPIPIEAVHKFPDMANEVAPTALARIISMVFAPKEEVEDEANVSDEQPRS